MNRETICARIEEIGIVPAVRVFSAEEALFAVEAVSSGGIPVAEVTLTVPNAISVISELAGKHHDLIVGAGTVRDLETARRSIDAGAKFLSSPGLDLEIVEFALKRGIPVLPGALTPSEIMAAWRAGSDFVKVFPCSVLGGPSYIKALKSPFPDVKLIAAGGVNQKTVAEFVMAGAVAVGVGRDLVSPEAVRRRERHWIHELTRRFLGIVGEARAQAAP